MPVEPINPDGLPTPESCARLSVATGTRTVHLAAQVEQAYLDVATVRSRPGSGWGRVGQRLGVPALEPPR